MNNKKKLGFGEKFAYGMGDCAANVYVAMAGTFLSGYYTDTVGISILAVGTMMLLTRIFDGVTDLLMGALVDKTKSKYGKARPWVLWTAPFMAIGLVWVFSVPTSMYGSNSALIWAYISYIFLNCIVYTANNLPYNALLSRMTLDVQDRTETASMRFIMTSLVSMVVSSLTPILIGSLGWTKLAILYGIIEIAMLVWCFIGCKEHVGENEETGEVVVDRTPLKEALPALLKNKYFYLQALLFLTLYINVVTVGSSTYYFFDKIVGNIAIMGTASIAGTIPAIISNFANPKLVQKFGKRKTMMGGTILMIVGSIIVGMGGSSLPVVLAGLIVKGFGQGPIMSGVFAMTADVVDYGEWKTGIRSEGLVNSCTSFGMKVGIGLGSAVGAWILAFGGYDGMAEVQSASALASIKFAYGYFGAILGVVILLIIFAMNIDKYIVQIQADLQAKKRG